MSRAKTKEEALDEFMGFLAFTRDHVAGRDAVLREKLDLFVHSMLCGFDGVSQSLPFSVNMEVEVHPDNKQFCIDEGEDWWEEGTQLWGGEYLHDVWGKRWSRCSTELHMEAAVDLSLLGIEDATDLLRQYGDEPVALRICQEDEHYWQARLSEEVTGLDVTVDVELDRGAWVLQGRNFHVWNPGA